MHYLAWGELLPRGGCRDQLAHGWGEQGALVGRVLPTRASLCPSLGMPAGSGTLPCWGSWEEGSRRTSVLGRVRLCPSRRRWQKRQPWRWGLGKECPVEEQRQALPRVVPRVLSFSSRSASQPSAEGSRLLVPHPPLAGGGEQLPN